jgi:hypothetical protein
VGATIGVELRSTFTRICWERSLRSARVPITRVSNHGPRALRVGQFHGLDK